MFSDELAAFIAWRLEALAVRLNDMKLNPVICFELMTSDRKAVRYV